MASRIQIARGKLASFKTQNLLEGEMFWVNKNTSQDSETSYRARASHAYDEGTLYIGRPSLNPESSTKEQPIPIAGARTFKALVQRGNLTKQTSLKDDVFWYVKKGDFFIWANDAPTGEFGKYLVDGKKGIDFRKGDILLITNADYNIEADPEDAAKPDIGKSFNVQYTRIKTGSGDAYQTDFDNSNNDFTSNNVQDALEELEWEKLSYRGIIPSQDYLDTLRPEIGTLWLVTKDGLIFPEGVTSPDSTHGVQKGDFACWQNEEKGWVIIPSGYTDADEIDYSGEEPSQTQADIGTFDGQHMIATSNLQDVKQALDFLLTQKAQLDIHGKVPLSQLHDTVLGAMQYRGVWNPTLNNDPNGVVDPTYQSNWPLCDDDSEDNEKLPYGENRPGDYYIVTTTLANVQYVDKDSVFINDEGETVYGRTIEFNNGDWIVYSTSNYTNGDGDKYIWEKIDNSDRISQLNFVITGYNAGQDDFRKPEDEISSISVVGTPTFNSRNKIVLVNEGNGEVTIAGSRLVDQVIDEDGEPNFLPKYFGKNNTLKNSTISNYTIENITYTQTGSHLKVGKKESPFNAEVHGDITLFPKLTTEDGVAYRKDTKIQFVVNQTYDQTIEESALNVRPDSNQVDGSDVYLPDESSKIIGKLAGVDFISNRVTKSVYDNYLESTSIQEHMKVNSDHVGVNGKQTYHDDDILSIEFKAPEASVNTLGTRCIILGERANLNEDSSTGGAPFGADGKLDGTVEKLSKIYANPLQENFSEVINLLPSSSGILINDTDYNRLINGTENRLPIFGKPDTEDNVEKSILVDSKIRQTASALFNALKSNISIKDDDEDELLADTYGDEDSIKDNVVIDTDTVIGEVETNPADGRVVIKPRSLMVTKSLILGNDEANATHIIPGRDLFSDDSQYRNPFDESTLPIKDVYVAPPTVSGVLLTSNSRIDGLEW